MLRLIMLALPPQIQWNAPMRAVACPGPSSAESSLVLLRFHRLAEKIKRERAASIVRKTARVLACLTALTGTVLLGGCASPQVTQPVTLPPGTRLHDVAKAAGQATGAFSYLKNGRKYDLVNFANGSSTAVFEDSRLVALASREAMTDWDKRVAQCLQRGDLPFENGMEPLHAWVLEQRKSHQQHDKSRAGNGSSTAGSIAEGAAAVVILSPLAPFFLAGAVCGGTEYAMTGKDRRQARVVNDALLGSGVSYNTFLAQLPKPDLQVSNGPCQVREYRATKGSFFTWNDYVYDVGFTNGKVLWVAHNSPAISQQAYKYWVAHPNAGSPIPRPGLSR